MATLNASARRVYPRISPALTSVRGFFVTSLVCVAIAAGGCGGAPSAPDRHGPISVAIVCEPQAMPYSACHATVSCSLYPCSADTPGDITAIGTWTSDNPGVMRIAGPGMLEAVTSGDTVVRVSHPATGAASWPVSVFPGTPPLQTFEIGGTVYDGSDPARPPLDGATVEVLFGLLANRAAVSGVAPSFVPGFTDWSRLTFPAGQYRIPAAPKGAYRLRASKPGYLPQELEIPGPTYSANLTLQRN